MRAFWQAIITTATNIIIKILLWYCKDPEGQNEREVRATALLTSTIFVK